MPKVQQIKLEWFHELFSAEAVCLPWADSAHFSCHTINKANFLMTEEALKPVCLFGALW